MLTSSGKPDPPFKTSDTPFKTSDTRGRPGYPLANGLSRGREPRARRTSDHISWGAELSMCTHEREATQDGAVDTDRQAPWGNRGGCEVVARSASVVHIVPVPHLGELWKYYYVGGLHSIKRPITGREALIALAEGGLSMREGRTWGLGWPGRLKRLADRVADPTPSSATPNAASKYAGAMPFIRDRCIMRRLSCGTGQPPPQCGDCLKSAAP